MSGVSAQWIWLAIGIVLLVTEIATTTLVALPLALGAFAAAVVALFGGPVELQFAAAAIAAVGGFAGLRPLARRINSSGTVEGIGAHRLINATAIALTPIDPDEGGLVRIGGEEWHASTGTGAPAAVGARLRVVAVEGSRVVVVEHGATDQPAPSSDGQPGEEGP